MVQLVRRAISRVGPDGSEAVLTLAGLAIALVATGAVERAAGTGPPAASPGPALPRDVLGRWSATGNGWPASGDLGRDTRGRPSPPPQPLGWASGFEQEAGFSEWSTWGGGEDLQSQLYGGHSVVSPSGPSVPPLEGRKVAHFQVSKPMWDTVVYREPSDVLKRRVHSKVMKEWRLPGSPKTDDLGRQMDRLPGGSPAGTYRASFFFPESYEKGVEEPWSLWTNIFQFKEAWTENGLSRQAPQWWINVSRAGGWSYDPEDAPGIRTEAPNRPVLHVNRPRHEAEQDGYRPRLRVVPLGRWFEIRAEVFPGERIEWYLDGERFDTSFDGEHPVGLSRGDSESSPARSEGWLFGIGHYDGIGQLWADGASFTPRELLDD